MATISYPREPSPSNPPNFSDPNFKRRIHDAVSGLSASDVLYHLSECLMHRDEVILKVLRIYWSLWRFGLGHQRVIQVAWGEHSSGYNRDRVERYNPGKYNSSYNGRYPSRSLFDVNGPIHDFTVFL
jgi:hypothetical protein